jgi:hypothetical protein
MQVRRAAWVILIWTTAALAAGCASTSSPVDDDQDGDGARAVVTLTRSRSSRSTAREAAPRVALPPTLRTRPSVQYLTRLSDAVELTRVQMPQITASAEAAAARVTRGGRLYVAGTQADFAAEMLDRAGGLAMVSAVPRILNRGDVVLYAVPSRLTVADRIRISHWQSQGVFVVGFASAKLSSDPYFQPDVLIDSGDEEGLLLGDGTICPSDTVMNLVNAWTWTGEFVAACTRLGRMPVLNQSFGEAGAFARSTKYRGVTFHDDVKVAAVPAGSLGTAYLDAVSGSLAGMMRKAPAALEFGGRWLRDTPASSRGLYAASQIFPAHFADARAPQPFGKTGELQLRQPPQTPLALVIGYEDPPQIAIDFATMRRGRLIYTSTRRDAADARQEVLYIDPHTPRGDACVKVDGYDVKILPASSVMQAAVYWSLIAESAPPPPPAAAAAPTRRGPVIATSRTPGE